MSKKLSNYWQNFALEIHFSEIQSFNILMLIDDGLEYFFERLRINWDIFEIGNFVLREFQFVFIKGEATCQRTQGSHIVLRSCSLFQWLHFLRVWDAHFTPIRVYIVKNTSAALEPSTHLQRNKAFLLLNGGEILLGVVTRLILKRTLFVIRYIFRIDFWGSF